MLLGQLVLLMPLVSMILFIDRSPKLGNQESVGPRKALLVLTSASAVLDVSLVATFETRMDEQIQTE